MGVVFVVASVSLKGLCACFSVRRKYCVSFDLRAVASVLASFSFRERGVACVLAIFRAGGVAFGAWPV